MPHAASLTSAGPPFAATRAVRSIDDVRALEAIPIEQAVTARSTYDIIRRAAQAFGDRPALTFLPSADPSATPIHWSFQRLLAGVQQTANALHALGVGAQDAVAALLPGCMEYQLVHWGGAAAGIVQPLNPLLTLDKLASLMNAAKAKVLIAWGADDDAGYWAKAMALRERVPSLKHVLRVAPLGETAAPPLPPGVIDFAAALAAQPDTHLVSGRDIHPGDIAAYFHTGGTTGAPKLARHSHGAQVFTAWACVQMQGMNPSDVIINGYPLFHVAGVLPGSLAALSSGVETIIPTPRLYRNPQVIQNFWRLVERYRVTVLSAVPTVLAALAAVPVGDADISSVRYCRTGAAILPPELATRFEREFGLHIHESLGMTEMAGISSITPLGVHAPPGCVGFRLPYSQVRVVALDDQGGASDTEVPRGQSGMLLFKSPNVFSGFLDEADTARAFAADGWLATGDLGFLDAEERLHLSGRSKDLIIRSGHNIDPKTIEDALGAHPAVQLCAAVGAPDAYAGELPVVFATLVPGQSANVDDLLAFASARVDEKPAQPKHVHLIDSMPMTNVGKIYKPALRAQAAGLMVRSLIAPLCTGLPPAQQPRVDSSEDGSVCVRLPGAAPASLAESLRKLLDPLPVKTQVVRD
jgi:fatty-acyl-CoA synthase